MFLKLDEAAICPMHHLESEWLFWNNTDQRLRDSCFQAPFLTPVVEKQADDPRTNSSMSHKGPDIFNTLNRLGQKCSHSNMYTPSFPKNRILKGICDNSKH